MKENIQSSVDITESEEIAKLKFKIDLVSYLEKLASVDSLPFINKYKPPKRIEAEILGSFKKWVSELRNPIPVTKNPESIQPAKQVEGPFNQLELQFLKQFIAKAMAGKVQPPRQPQHEQEHGPVFNNPPPIV
jgi:hypothetical protein